jgi:hypothetical protein
MVSAVARSRGLDVALRKLRRELPARVRIVVGGAAAQRLKPVPEGVLRLARVEELGPLLPDVRQAARL